MADFSNFGKLIGKNETEEEKKKRLEVEKGAKESSNKKGYFKKLFDKVKSNS